MTLNGFWEVWTTVMLWVGVFMCTIFAVVNLFLPESRRVPGLPTLFMTVAVLCLIALGVLPR